MSACPDETGVFLFQRLEIFDYNLVWHFCDFSEFTTKRHPCSGVWVTDSALNTACILPYLTIIEVGNGALTQFKLIIRFSTALRPGAISTATCADSKHVSLDPAAESSVPNEVKTGMALLLHDVAQGTGCACRNRLFDDAARAATKHALKIWRAKQHAQAVAVQATKRAATNKKIKETKARIKAERGHAERADDAMKDEDEEALHVDLDMGDEDDKVEEEVEPEVDEQEHLDLAEIQGRIAMVKQIARTRRDATQEQLDADDAELKYLNEAAAALQP